MVLLGCVKNIFNKDFFFCLYYISFQNLFSGFAFYNPIVFSTTAVRLEKFLETYFLFKEKFPYLFYFYDIPEPEYSVFLP